VKALAVGACLTALNAGCGSSSNHAATTSVPTTADTATVAEPPVSTQGSATTSVGPAASTGQGSSTPTSTPQTGGTPAGAGGGGSRAQNCGTVSFTPGSSHGAFQISATGASCSTARAVAGAARNCFGCRYVAQGYHCTGRQVTTGLVRVNYTCIEGESLITFVRG
jgi:hypothetical protein